MLIVHEGSGFTRDLIVQVRDPDATIADLCRALTPDRPITALVVDGRETPPATPLDRAAIGDGSVVRRRDDPGIRPTAAVPGEPVIEVIGGLDVGRRLPVPVGASLLGRRHRAVDQPTGAGRQHRIEVRDPTVSARQLTIHRDGDRIRIGPLGSTNPTLLAGVPVTAPCEWPFGAVLTCGRARFRLGRHPDPIPSRDALDGAPPWTLHRIPEEERGDPPEPLALPDEPPALPAVTPVGLVAVIGSVAMAGVLVAVLGNWMYALFAGLGPVLAALSALDSRRRRSRQRRRDGRRRRLDLVRFETLVLRRRDEERRRADERLPSAHEAVRIATGGPGGCEPHPSCWRRRSDGADAHTVRLGRGPVPWTPPLHTERSRAPSDVRGILDATDSIPGAPVALALEPGRPIVIIGPIRAGRAIARSILLQAATVHGPADLGIAVLAGDDRANRWSWANWLPHTIGVGGFRMVALDAETRSRTADLLHAPDAPPGTASPSAPDPSSEPIGARRLVLVDDPHGLRARRGPVRRILRTAEDRSAGIVPVVIVEDGPIPAGGFVLRVGPCGEVRFTDGRRVRADGIANDTARTAAIALARATDPEVDDTDRILPARVDLVDAVGPDRVGIGAIAARWRTAGADPDPIGIIGTGVTGPVPIDLVADGPHALIAGTTGSGKSELLRSLIISLALGSSPDHLTFVLIDFKGGSAFDACADLPHTIGVVTDLDEHLADRALTCLEAELRHREQRLRAIGATDLTEFRRATDPAVTEPLPRMVVVIDEFATLASELPEFVDALVGIAQRGRSLGVHLILATQRPSGAVDDNIRANTALRIALRVQDRNDSDDVIGSPEAADLPRNRPGRAVVRFGPSESLTLQTAYVSGHALDPQRSALALRRFEPDDVGAVRTGSEERPSDLAAIVDHLGSAWEQLGGRAPREVWPDPLPTILPGPLPDEAEPHEGLPIGLADVPERQRREPHRWSPDGPLLAIGLPGSGTTSVLTAGVLAAARRWSADELHVQIVDCGRGELGPLVDLPHVGSVITEADTERQRRLFDRLAALFAERASGSRRGPRQLVVVDGVGAFHDRWGDRPDGPWAILSELVRRGSALGIHTLLAAEGSGRVPHQLLSACRQRLVLRLGDRSDFAVYGVPPAMVPDLPVERAIDPEGPRLVQIARPTRGLAREVSAVRASTPPAASGPLAVGVLPESVDLGRLGAPDRPLAVSEPDGTLSILVGVSDRRLALARLVLPAGAHALIAGAPRSGRTTALATIALAAVTVGHRVLWVGAGAAAPAGARVCEAADLGELDSRSEPTLILVDDADRLADDPILAGIVADRLPGRHVIAAARGDRLRSSWGSWLREVGIDRLGILLDPDRDLDGDLLGVRLPRDLPVAARPGLGWLVGDPSGFAQIALPR